MSKTVPKKGQEELFPINQDPANILGMTDVNFGKHFFHFFLLFNRSVKHLLLISAPTTLSADHFYQTNTYHLSSS